MSVIINPLIEEYIDELYTSNTMFLDQLRKDAEIDHIPIITKDTEQFMRVILTMNKPHKILEIGTAIGYSAISFASALPEVKIVSIELSDKMYERALVNIKESGLESRITVIKGDAKEVITSLKENFDMIFIDAAKGQYKNFFLESEHHLSPSGIIVSDNVLYKGMTASDEYYIKRKRTIIKRMRAYLDFIVTHPQYETAVLPIGDGIAVSVRKVENRDEESRTSCSSRGLGKT